MRSTAGVWLVHNAVAIAILVSVLLSLLRLRHQRKHRRGSEMRSRFLPGTVVVSDLGARITELDDELREEIEDPAAPEGWAALRALLRLIGRAKRRSHDSDGDQSKPRAFVFDYEGGRTPRSSRCARSSTGSSRSPGRAIRF